MKKMDKINWLHDLDQLKNDLPKLHKKDIATNNPAFYTQIETLKQNIENLRMYEIIMEFSKIVATVNDAHTAVMLPRTHRIPFDCYVFCEGVFITQTDEKNTHLIHCNIIAIEKTPIQEILEKLTEIIPHENMQFVLSSIPTDLVCADILYGLNIITNPKNIMVTLQNRKGKISQHNFAPIKYADYVAFESKIDTLPLYRRNTDLYYWSHFEKGIFYINYNKCRDMPTQTVERFCEGLKSFLANNQEVEKIVIDLRNNKGGNSELFSPFLNWLVHDKRLKEQTIKLYVFVGRDTFSSALLNTYFLKFESNAVFVGEPTGGKPNCYGEVKYFDLESSRLIIRYSTNYYDIIEDDSQLSFLPDVYCKVSIEDYINSIDPCMELIKENKRDI